ncbi:MAG: PilN domain-containing protein [Fuerstia sp.]|nr:PilN domain-containing protein [Fuerstiella sp.]
MNRRSINLLTWRFRLYLLVRTRLLQWSVIWAVGSLLMVIWWQLESRRLSAAQEALAIMESRCLPLQQMQRENMQLARRVRDLKSHQSLLTRLNDEQLPYRLLGLLSQKVSECQGTLRIDSMAIDKKMETERLTPTEAALAVKKAAAGKPVAPQMHEVTILTLNGVADGNITLSQFVGLLRDSQVFQTVELISSIGADNQTRRSQSYLVKCVL